MQHVHHLLPHDELEGPGEVCELSRTINGVEGFERLAMDDSVGEKHKCKRLILLNK